MLRWFSEVTRIDATESAPGPIFTYLGIVGYVAPWTIFFLVGIFVVARQIKARLVNPDLLALLLLIVPLVVMSFAKDRQDRYALPMVAAAAVVAAIGVREYLAKLKFGALIESLHWLMLTGIAVGLPLLGATPLLKQSTGEPWFGPEICGTGSNAGRRVGAGGDHVASAAARGAGGDDGRDDAGHAGGDFQGILQQQFGAE